MNATVTTNFAQIVKKVTCLMTIKVLANEDTLLLMMFLALRKLENICCGHKMFLNKIRNTFLCLGHKICVRNKCCARGQKGKHFCRQQCVRNNVCSFARALRQYNSNNSLTPQFKGAFSKKEIIWMNSLTYRPRLKKELWSKFRL